MGSESDHRLQRAPSTNAVLTHPGRVPIPVDVLRSGGRALEPPVASDMAARFGHDFSCVRVHADADAADSARAAGALAYTVGNHVVFGAGRFDPHSVPGQRLLAHELAHVVQQGGREPFVAGGVPPGPTQSEAEADRAADAAAAGRRVPRLGVLGGTALQRSPDPAAPGNLFPPVPGVALPVLAVEIGADEPVSKDSPKLVSVAQQAAQGAGALGPTRTVELSAFLSEGTKLSSTAQVQERKALSARMHQIRAVLRSLGVPQDRIDVQPPYAFSRSARGQVSVSVRARGAGLVPPAPQKPILGPQPGPQPSSKMPSLAELLTVKLGPVTVELPKSAKARLPVELRKGKTLVISLSLDLPTKFSVNLSLDGTRVVRVSLAAGGEYDLNKKSFTGSAGLKIETLATVCSATSPEASRAKIAAAGEGLKKAGKEWQDATDAETRLDKSMSIAGKIAEMYEAIDKAKAGCKQVPRATFEFGFKGPLERGQETDPKKLESYVGPTLTIPF